MFRYSECERNLAGRALCPPYFFILEGKWIISDFTKSMQNIFFCAFICIDDGFIDDLAKKKGDQYVFSDSESMKASRRDMEVVITDKYCMPSLPGTEPANQRILSSSGRRLRISFSFVCLTFLWLSVSSFADLTVWTNSRSILNTETI